MSAPLTELTKKGVRFSWTPQHENAFLALKWHLCTAPVLAYPNFAQPFILQTDASNVGLGAVLAQHDIHGTERVIAYASCTLSNRERNFTTMEKEVLAVVFAVKHFRCYLLGTKFRVITDNSALKWLHSIEPKGRIARWIMDLQEFDFDVVHRPGGSDQTAYALSRLPQTKVPGSKDEDLDALHSCFITLHPSANVLTAQCNDPDIFTVLDMKEKGFPKPPFFVWKNNATLRAYWNCWDQLFITDGLLVKSLAVHNEFPRNAVVIPRALLPTVLQGLHNSPSGGHMGITRTLHRARERFFWPKMRETIDTFIQNCQVCSQIKDKSCHGKAPLKPVQVSEPFVFWALDYMGPLQETAKGNKCRVQETTPIG